MISRPTMLAMMLSIVMSAKSALVMKRPSRMIVTLSRTDRAELVTHKGQEFNYVLEGAIELAYGKETYTIAAGDSLYYDSIVPHHLHAAGDAPAKILAVVYAPF